MRLSPAVVFLLLQVMGRASAKKKDEQTDEHKHKHFINWDVHEYPTVPGWNWHRPFPDDGDAPMGFETTCNAVQTFYARNYKLADLRRGEDHDLYPFADAIEALIDRRAYPGSWDGVDHGGLQRDLLMMPWRDLPVPVRRWIEEKEMRPDAERQHAQRSEGGGTGETRDKSTGPPDRAWRFMVFHKKPRRVATTQTETATLGPVPTDGVEPARWKMPSVSDRDKVVFFAPGQIYPLLPLFVAKGSGCEGIMTDLSKYRKQAEDEKVVAWPFEHSKPENNDAEVYFKIRAEHVRETDHGRDHRLLWDSLMRNARRSERKMTREERMKMRDEL